MKRHYTIYSLLLVLLFFHAPTGTAETIFIATDDPFWKAKQGVLNASPDVLTVAVNGETPIVLDMNGIATLTFDYQADGWFTLSWDSILDQPYTAIDAFAQSAQLQKGNGKITIDFRRNRHWGESTVPYLKLHGRGTLVIRHISARMVEEPEDYGWRKRMIFFMMPESLKPHSVNFLTPIYADEKSNLYFADVLGTLVMAAGIIIAAISWKF